MKRPLATGLAFTLLVGVALAGVAFVWRDESVRNVEARAGDPITPEAQTNDADELGADRLRRYLQALLTCGSEGEAALVEVVLRDRDRQLRDRLRRTCASTGRPAAEEVSAESQRTGFDDDVTQDNRRLWRLDAGDTLPDESYVALDQTPGDGPPRGWTVEEVCFGSCREFLELDRTFQLPE